MPLQRNSDSEERTCGQDEGCAAHGRHRQRRQECRRREDGRRGRRTEGTCCQKQTRARGGNPCAHNWSTRHLQVLLAADGGEVYALSNKCAHMGIRYVMGRRRPGVVRTLPAHSLAHSPTRSLAHSLVQPDSLVGKTKLLQVRRFDSTGGHALYVRTLPPPPLASPHSCYALRPAARAKFPADASPVPRTVPSLP